MKINKEKLSEAQLKKYVPRLQQSRLENDQKEYQRQAVLFEEFDLDYNMFRILQFLADYPEGAEPSFIADSLLVLRSTVANVLNRLEKTGLISRTLNTEDRRRINVSLTPEGEKIAKRGIAISKDYHRRALSALTAEEIEKYISLRMKVAAARDAAIEEIKKERSKGEYKIN